MRAISCVPQEIGGGRRVVVKGWHFRGILHRSTTPLELLPCLLNGNTHLLPTASQSPHLNICPATGNDLLQTLHDTRIALHFGLGGSVNGCFSGNVGDKFKLGAGANVLKFSDGVIVKIVPDAIKKDQATALPLWLASLDGLELHCIHLEAVGDGVALVLHKGTLAAASADVTIKTTDSRLNCIGRELTLLHRQIEALPTPNAIPVTKTVLPPAVTSDLHLSRLEFSIASIGLGRLV
jgi:hypothetical protein